MKIKTASKMKLKAKKSEKGKNLPGYGVSKGYKMREKTLLKEYKKRDKVGGITDRRLPDKDRRYVIEKMRIDEQVAGDSDEELKFTHKGRLLTTINKFDTVASDDEDERDTGKIDAETVGQHFFAGGLFTKTDPAESKKKFAEFMATKIQDSKKDKMEKQEDNERMRELTSEVDEQWTSSVRFMLDKVANLKPRNALKTDAIKKATTDFDILTNQLMASKSVMPEAPNVKDEMTTRAKQVARLEKKVEAAEEKDLLENGEETASEAPVATKRKAPESAGPAAKKPALESVDAMDDEDQFEYIDLGSPETTSEEPKSSTEKSTINLLRLMAEMKERKTSVIVYICDKLSKMQYRGLKDVIRCLELCQLLTELLKGAGVGKSGIFSPELVHSLLHMLSLATRDTNGLLKIKHSMADVNASLYETLPISLCESSTRIPKAEMPCLRLASLYRLLSLLGTVMDLYAPLPSSPEIFASVWSCLARLPSHRYPPGLVKMVDQLEEKSEELGHKPRAVVKPTKALKMLPQLEPRFTERFDARKRPKDNRRTLQKKYKSEMRGAMKEIRRDAQFIASVKEKETKLADDDRKMKTKKLLGQIANEYGEIKKMRFGKIGKS